MFKRPRCLWDKIKKGGREMKNTIHEGKDIDKRNEYYEKSGLTWVEMLDRQNAMMVDYFNATTRMLEHQNMQLQDLVNKLDNYLKEEE